ncbi:MAG: S41 family peptidase, partial [Ferruginibacter sp.]
MNKQKLNVWMPVLLSVAMVWGMYLGYKMRDAMPRKSFFYLEKHKPIQEILDLVKAKYVDDIDVSALSDTAIAAILSKLDPHSHYIPAKDVEAANEDISGTFYGIGIEFNIFNDTLHIINVIKDGPAYKAGLLTGDKLLKAGDTVMAGRKKDVEEVRKLLRGNRGSLLPVVVLRGNKQLAVTLAREYIPVNSVEASYMFDKEIGYIRLNKFSQKSYKEFMQSLERLKEKGLQKLILDLRGNGGGILDDAVDIADEFLEGDRLITFTEGKHVAKKEYRSRREGQFEKGPLVILADENTASASEVLIGALQDWDRAEVVGRPTFGKGLVQEQFELSDNSAVRLTVSRYYTPLGRSIQRSYSNGSKAYYDPATRLHYIYDSVTTINGKKYKTKKGKVVFGGGGITPDYLIKGDTGRLQTVSAKIFSKGFFNNVTYQYVVQHADTLKRYDNPETFASTFKITPEAW